MFEEIKNLLLELNQAKLSNNKKSEIEVLFKIVEFLYNREEFEKAKTYLKLIEKINPNKRLATSPIKTFAFGKFQGKKDKHPITKEILNKNIFSFGTIK